MKPTLAHLPNASSTSTATATDDGDDHHLTNTHFVQSWEPALAKQIAANVAARQQQQQQQQYTKPYMVALVGIPGSGKSVSSLLTASLLEDAGCKAMIFPHDGYHYSLDYLKTFPDADSVIYRRGAPDTFDPAALLRDLQRVQSGTQELIQLPAFDHAAGDPEPGKHHFDRSQHVVVLCEGLYLLHDADGWERMREIFDLTVFIDSDIDHCMERLKIRNQVIPGYTAEEIAERVELVDRVNAETVLKSKVYADVTVTSVVTAPAVSTDRSSNNVPTTHQEEALISNSVDHGDSNTTNDDSAWTMDIVSRRAGSDSLASLQRNDSFAESGAAVLNERQRPVAETATASTLQQEQNPPPPPPASAFVGSWEPDMAVRIRKAVAAHPTPDRPYMVAVVGTPGSGKSWCSFLLANLLEESGIATMVMPHDGYHYPLDYLKTFPDADSVIYRRGAPDTFDPAALLRDLHRIQSGPEELIKLPAFDHARGDPEPDTHIFDRNQHSVVLCEGLYLLHNSDGWNNVADVFDLKIFIQSDLEMCMDRVKIRNQCIPGYTPDQIAERVDKVDRINALTVIRSKARADVVVDAVKV